MIDFHTHILPGMDDGSSSAQESVEMLKMLKSQGVDSVILTPHFYAYKTDIKTFLADRRSSFDSLVKQLRQENVSMDLYLAAEVLYFDELWRIDDLEKLCIDGTKSIILEMPFSKWSENMINGVGKLVSRGLNPILAHFDRYARIHKSMNQVYELVNTGAMLQMNCDCFDNPFKRMWAVSMLKKGIVSAIGSDCHNMEKRVPNFDIAASYIEKNLQGKPKNLLVMQQNMIMRNAVKSYDASSDTLKK